MKQNLLLFLVLMISTVCASGVRAAGLLPETPARVEAGAALYKKNCMACHGEKGDGNGPAGKMMKPKPRDFKVGNFVKGDKPENIFTTITDGLQGTAMAPFKSLSDEERSSLTYYVLKLKSGK